MRIVGHSMMPVLRPGALVWVNEDAYRAAAPRRGDMVVARPVALHGRACVKRVVGLPHEQVALGERAWRLGAQEYLLAGDALHDSVDSRVFGPVVRHELVGRVTKIC